MKTEWECPKCKSRVVTILRDRRRTVTSTYKLGNGLISTPINIGKCKVLCENCGHKWGVR